MGSEMCIRDRSNDFADISIMARPRFEYREVDGLKDPSPSLLDSGQALC